MDKLEKYNPIALKSKNVYEKSTCIIKDFQGNVFIKSKPVSTSPDTKYIVFVEGIGVNKKSNKPIHFISEQTGL